MNMAHEKAPGGQTGGYKESSGSSQPLTASIARGHDPAVPNQQPTSEVAARDYLNGVEDGYKIGYSEGHADGLREGLAEGPNHPTVIESVKRMFGDWDGADAARKRSTQRFKDWYDANRADGGDK